MICWCGFSVGWEGIWRVIFRRVKGSAGWQWRGWATLRGGYLLFWMLALGRGAVCLWERVLIILVTHNRFVLREHLVGTKVNIKTVSRAG